MLKKPILTIDGPAASGKGSVSKKIAQDFNLYYLETGIFSKSISICLSKVLAPLAYAIIIE